MSSDTVSAADGALIPFKIAPRKIGNLQSEIGNVFGAPAGIRTPNQQIMRRFEGHQQGETKRDEAVFTESTAVKVRYILLRLSTPSRHNHATGGQSNSMGRAE